MLSRRGFLGALGVASSGMSAMKVFQPILNQSFTPGDLTLGNTSGDEDFWNEVQRAYSVDRSMIYLNSGGVSPAPSWVQDAMKRRLDLAHEGPAYTMWRLQEPKKETVRTELARLFGRDPEEIAITRNASESLQICQFGFDLKAGDEVLTTNQDYPRMINTFKQRERREGIRLRTFSIPVPALDDDEIVRLFAENITSRTKLILMCHIINLTGQILPVKKVVHMARDRGIPVIVDGAHSFAHFQFTHEDLDCDYYTSSLHKWLSAPHGTGMLFVRKDKIEKLWPLMAADEKQDADIRKFEEIGTHPAANILGIGEAIAFFNGIGPARKEARLSYLTRYWSEPLLENPRFVMHTPRVAGKYCAIGTMQLKGVDSVALANYLWKSSRIFVVPIKHEEFEGIRVTPNVFTTHQELDRFRDVMMRIAEKGLPA